MEKLNLEQIKPIKTALKEAGFRVEEVAKLRKKTVITISGLAKKKERGS